jgi:hypothetical protein
MSMGKSPSVRSQDCGREISLEAISSKHIGNTRVTLTPLALHFEHEEQNRIATVRALRIPDRW